MSINVPIVQTQKLKLKLMVSRIKSLDASTLAHRTSAESWMARSTLG